MNRNNAAKAETADRAVKLEALGRQLEELLAILDQTEGCSYVALHVDQALNALRNVDRVSD